MKRVKVTEDRVGEVVVERIEREGEREEKMRELEARVKGVEYRYNELMMMLRSRGVL